MVNRAKDERRKEGRKEPGKGGNMKDSGKCNDWFVYHGRRFTSNRLVLDKTGVMAPKLVVMLEPG
jgi:hypothetical protein